ncbi:hypothetical protein AB1N83_012490 [Pleurotus pulmonarius]|nr:hypothetical protein EYR38_010015 [Pleurotus pulmonarius]
MDELEGRKNLVSREWKRKKGASDLPQPPPSGNRTPNGHIWAHEPKNMYYIDVRPGSKSSAITIWSESMIKEFGENYEETMAKTESQSEPLPSRGLPYPMLTRQIYFKKGCRRVAIQSDPLRKMVLAEYPEPKTASATKYLLPDFGTAYEPQFKLEEFLPADYFPEILLVNDPQGLTAGGQQSDPEAKVRVEASPRRYKLVYPRVYRHSIDYERPMAVDACMAHLNLAGAPSLRPSSPRGKYNIFRGAMRFDIPLLADTPDRSTGVVVKIADPNEIEKLADEAQIYNKIYGVARPQPDNLVYDYPSDAGSQRHLMEEWTGYNLLPPYIQYPVPVSAVVPKFYGYYEPEAPGNDRGGGEKLGAILLLEDCGTPVALNTLSKDHKTTCLSLLARLHIHGYLYNSHLSKILVQPGPLEKKPDRRGMEEPRFRIIGMGSAMAFEAFKAREMQGQYGQEDTKGGAKTGVHGLSILDAAREHKKIAKEAQARMAEILAKWKEAQRMEFAEAKKEMGVPLLS